MHKFGNVFIETTSSPPLTLSLSKGERPPVAAQQLPCAQAAMAFWVYILQCADGSYYIGHSDDLEVRLQQHHSGALGGYTKHRRPVSLGYSHDVPSRDDAFAVERQIKGWSRKKKEALIRGDWEELCQLARGRGRPSAHPSTGSG